MRKANLQKEPLAIIGIGCRLPGGSNSPDAFWAMMSQGKDAILEIPKDRWNVDAYYDPTPGKPGRSISRWGGFIESVDKFDPEFFGISPREADWMDPQQRLLLEGCAEALEDAGQRLEKLKGSDTGVFVGISTTDYSLLQSTLIEHTKADVYSATGGSISIAANRISYCFDFQGPSVSMDTACSSALTAVHVACQSLWRGNCSMALVGGVNAMVSPATFIAFSRMGMLSPTGRCKAFDSSADGFVRGEGVGAIVLKPLSAARAAGDKIYAVILGTAANQDGRTNGLTVPSPIAQHALVQQACRDAGIAPAEVRYVEAHGTGTPVGDPIEANALGTALGEGRADDNPCLVGSVKTNIGHLEAAAGIAGIIKTALVLKHGQIPANLHFKNPNPHIDFAKLKLRVVQQLENFPNDTGRMLAGINSFGFGGSNAHAILEAAPAEKPKIRKAPAKKSSDNRAVLLPLSARSTEALQAVVKNYQTLLTAENNGHTPSLPAICRASSVRRSHHPHRLCAVGHTRDEILEQLSAFLANETRPGLTVGHAPLETQAGPVFVFSGQGPQWWAMGRELLNEEPLFREKIEQCDKLFREFGDWSLLEELGRDEATSRLDQTAIAQPSIFALQVALAALWQSWGVKPAAVVGHSVGEVAAAHAAGIYDLREAARIIFHRGRTMNAAPNGRMLAAALDTNQANEIIAQHGGKISLAAINSPKSVTLSGEAEALEEISRSLEQRGVFNRFLQVHYAFHSAHMDPAKTDLLQSLGEIVPNKASLPFTSTVLGKQSDGSELAADYWWRNVREPVHFSDAMDALLQQGHRCFLELSAHPALLVSINECLAHRSITGTVLPSLRRQEKERATLLGSLGALHVAGIEIDWNALYPDTGERVELPRYPWQHERYWHEPDGHRRARLTRPDHPFLARKLNSATPAWISWLDQDVFEFLQDHRVQGHIVFPGAAYLDTAFSAGKALFGNEANCALEDVDFQKALFLPENKEVVHLQTSYNPAELTIKFSSRVGTSEDWSVNAVGKLQSVPHQTPPPPVDLARLRKTNWSHEVEGKRIYAGYELIGLSYGPSFQGLETVWRRDGESLGRIKLPEKLHADAEKNFIIHPSLLDACFQTLTLGIPENNPLEKRMLLPVFVDRVRLFARPGNTVWCHTRLTKISSRFATCDLQILDDDGRVLLAFEGFRSQAMVGSRAPRLDLPEEWLYDSRWDLNPLAATPAADVNFLPNAEKLALEVGAAIANSSRGAQLSRQQNLERGLNQLARAYLAASARKKSSQRRERRAPDALWLKLLKQFPGALPELTLMRRAADAMKQSPGRQDARPTTDGHLNTLEHLFQDSLTHRNSNRAIAEAVSAALQNQPRHRVVRILEIGAGTGGLTSHILPRLRADRTKYFFTDKDETLLSRAEQKFFDSPFVRFQKLDVERDFDEQKFDEKDFDIVIVSGLSSVAGGESFLERIKSALSPGGLLMVAAASRPQPWLEFVFGKNSGPQWLDLLGGFESSATVQPRGAFDIFIAQKSAATAPSAPSTAAVSQNAVGTWLLFADRSGTSRELALLLQERGAHVVTVFAGEKFNCIGKDSFEIAPSSVADMQTLFGEVHRINGKTLAGIVHLWALDMSPPAQLSAAALAEAEQIGCHSILHLVQTLTQTNVLQATKLWLVTRGAQPVNADDEVSCAQMPVIGLGRTIISEYRGLTCRMIDLTPEKQNAETLKTGKPKSFQRVSFSAFQNFPGDAESLLDELLFHSAESEVAYRDGARLVSRLVRTSLDAHVPPRKSGADRFGYRLEIPNPGVMDNLSFREIPRRKPAAGEVEIEICAAALNFRDVMKALGIYPAETEADLLPGDECSGRIIAIGKGVRGFKVGDEVIASGAGSFASHVTVPALTVVPKPSRITFEEAVTIPVTFMTAWYALHHLGRIKKGEKVLIQAGTGGVGLAAIQIAQSVGAEIFATAGSPEKRDFLHALGAQHVMDSRSLAFADEIRDITKGRGVDIVLNSLAGLAIAKGIQSLAPGGRFLEIGKRDIYQNTAVGLRPFRNNVSMHVIDLGQVMQNEPARVGELLRPIMAKFQSGEFHPLPHRVLPVSRIVSAFRLMAQAKHVGKIVVSTQNEKVSAARTPAKTPIRFSAKASYLITGGLGGFGLATAKWMIESGARNLVLTGRSGASTPEAKKAVADLRKLGAKVLVLKADVTNARDVARVFQKFPNVAQASSRRKLAGKMFAPLRGIIHTAMVLDDGILAQLTAERFTKVMAPKVIGAWNLHVASAKLPLDFFVMYSSVSSFVGAAGQGNYVAANSFLDGIAHYRRSTGRPAMAINFGAISEVGFLARNSNVKQLLESRGVLGIEPAQATEMLGKLLQSDCTQIGFMRVDWQKFADSPASSFNSPRYSEVVQFVNKGGNEGKGAMRGALLAAPAGERAALAVNQVREVVAKVLRTSPAKLDVARPLKEMGLDSLMAVELLTRVESEFAISVPPTKLNASATIATIATLVLETVTGATATPQTEAAPVPAEAGRVSPSAPSSDLAISGAHGVTRPALDDCVVTLRADGARAPLFLIHPAGGLASVYEPLVENLSAEQPVFGIQSRAYCDERGERETFAEIVRDYSDLVAKRQPVGPVLIGGFSVGGLFALTVARELEKRGRAVSFVGLVDSQLYLFHPNCTREAALRHQLIEMHNYFVGQIAPEKRLAEEELSRQATELAGKIMAVRGKTSDRGQDARAGMQLQLTLDWLAEHELIPSNGTASLVKQYASLFIAHCNMIDEMKLDAVAAPVWYWKASASNDVALPVPHASRFTNAGFSEEIMECRHYDLLQPPHVKTLAAGMESALQQAMEVTRGRGGVEVVAK